jgi:hypothetical protein
MQKLYFDPQQIYFNKDNYFSPTLIGYYVGN